MPTVIQAETGQATVIQSGGTGPQGATGPAATGPAALTDIQYSDIVSDFIINGINPTVPSPASLAMTIPTGEAVVLGQRTILALAVLNTYPASSDTYVSMNQAGLISFASVANGAAATAAPANAINLLKVVTNATAITGVYPMLYPEVTVPSGIQSGAANSFRGATVGYKITYGRYRDAVCAGFVANSTTPENIQVMGGGGDSESLFAGYSSRDSVALYAGNSAPISISGSSSTFTSTSVTATWSASLSGIPTGVFVDVIDGSTLYSGEIQSISGDTINVNSWTISPSSPATQGTPASGSSVIVNPVTKIWGANIGQSIGAGSQTTACAGIEVDTTVDIPGVTSWGYDSVNIGSETGTASFISRGSWTYHYVATNTVGATIFSVEEDGSVYSSGTIGGGGNLSGTLPPMPSSGILLGWNYTSGQGEADLIAIQGTGSAGGFKFYNYDGTTLSLIGSLAGGDLTIPGTATVAAATAAGEAVNLGQVSTVIPQLFSYGGGVAASTTYGQTLTLTAPCAGYLKVEASFNNNSMTGFGDVTLQILVNGTVLASDTPTATNAWNSYAAVAVTAGEALTVVAQYVVGTTALSIAINVRGIVTFLPNP